MNTAQKLTVKRNRQHAFTLIEVVIATALFFMAMFAILDLVLRNVRAAHALQKAGPTAGMVAAQLSLTNKLEEGSFSDNFEEYPGYSWTADSQIYATNGMFLVNITVFNGNTEYDKMNVLFYRPESTGSAGPRMMFSDGPRGASSELSTRNSGSSQSGRGNNFQNNGNGPRGGNNNRGNFNGRQR